MGGTPFAAPSLSQVSGITAQLLNRPDKGENIEAFEVPKSFHQAFLEILNDAKVDTDPMKWQFLGNMAITHSTGSVEVRLFWTGKQLGAFQSNGHYYRGGSDTGFIELISSARNDLSGQDAAKQPTPQSGSK